ncbi:hypothetical protein Aau02nite_70680 [Amorphoplanes auranticolor]|uniref:Integrase catalytic domain-containing protein n=1 Tax=Actinoplanes auranticolor TaxID=47988 RepID=A0A919SRT0_9ACTN|nr:hypothetical protein Aau02nite_70680 [Actinoplanes auranticolor]
MTVVCFYRVVRILLDVVPRRQHQFFENGRVDRCRVSDHLARDHLQHSERTREVNRRAPGNRWYVDETYVKVNGVWRYVYRVVDQFGQIIDVLVSPRRDAEAARRLFRRALSMLKVRPNKVVTDAPAIYPAVLAELIPSAWHHVEQYANNLIEADHSKLQQRLRPMRGLQIDRTAQVIIAGHAFIQNLRRGHYELGIDATPAVRVTAAFTELARAV